METECTHKHTDTHTHWQTLCVCVCVKFPWLLNAFFIDCPLPWNWKEDEGRWLEEEWRGWWRDGQEGRKVTKERKYVGNEDGEERWHWDEDQNRKEWKEVRRKRGKEKSEEMVSVHHSLTLAFTLEWVKNFIHQCHKNNNSKQPSQISLG